MNLLQLVLFFGTGLITYKLFAFSAPTEEIILDKFVKAYRPQASSSRDIAERVGETLGNALRKIVNGERHQTHILTVQLSYLLQFNTEHVECHCKNVV